MSEDDSRFRTSEEQDSQSPGAGPSRTPSVRSASSLSSRKGKERATDLPRSANGVAGHDDGDTDEESDDDEEEEPTLKYSKLKGKIPEILARDRASAIAVTPRVIAIGTDNGMVHILSYEGSKINAYRPHEAGITCIRIDEENDFVATSSLEGQVRIHSLTSPETHGFDYKRPMQAIALEPGFAKKNTRAFVCGGLAGNLIYQEKGWLGYKEQILHSGEGPIWAVEWTGTLIAWANDLGVKIYDTESGQRIGYIDRGADPPRAELFKCSLVWQDDRTLIIGWADYIKIVRVRNRPRAQAATGLPSLTVEISSVYQVDCMISGIAQLGSSYVILAYISPDDYINEATDDPAEQRRKAANAPELRIINKGEEVTADALALSNFHMYGCNRYSLAKSHRPGEEAFFVVSPADVIVVRPRDEVDHIEWLVGKERYEEALESAEGLQARHGNAFDAKSIGIKYMQYLVDQSDFARAAGLAVKVLGQAVQHWDQWIRMFMSKDQLDVMVPIIPVEKPQLEPDTYKAVLDYLLMRDKKTLLETVKRWPSGIYDIDAIMSIVQAELNATKSDPILLECLAELHLRNRQPAKALPLFLRLRHPQVFDLIREQNLFTSIQEQALLLVEFDRERRKEPDDDKYGPAIHLLVDHIHSIPIDKVVRQLEVRPKFLYLYLDAVFEKDSQLCFTYSDQMVELCAEFEQDRLLPFLRASNLYDLEKAYRICKEKDYVPEMVFLLGRMGNNKQALMLIIKRLGDVQKAIDFAKEQADEDLWEDLLGYSETRPSFIRALLEHVGAEINPIRLIRRIRDGMEIPGLRPAAIKILQASNLQVSLLEGCHRILNGDCAGLAMDLQRAQTGSVRGSPDTTCAICSLPAFPPIDNPALAPLVLLYLCRHSVHAGCALLNPDLELPLRQDNTMVNQLLAKDHRGYTTSRKRDLGGKLSHAAAVRVRVGECPACVHSRGGVATA